MTETAEIWPRNVLQINSDSKLASGSVYTLYDGKFGSYRNIVVKQAKRQGISLQRGKTHEELVINDIQMLQKLDRSDLVMRLIHWEQTAENINLVVFKYDYNLAEFLEGVEDGSKLIKELEPTTKLFNQMFQAISYLHGLQIVHCDIKLKNLYINRCVISKYALTLGGLKHAKQFNSTESSEEFNLKRSVDIQQAAIVMYSFLKKRIVEESVELFQPDWTDDRSYDYKQLHLKHLVKVILSNPNLPIDDILSHPFFLDEHGMANFVAQLLEYCEVDRDMDRHMEFHREIVFTGSWTSKVHPAVAEACRGYPPNTFIGLWLSHIERWDHLIEDPEALHNLIGYTQEDHFKFWQRIFPAYFIYLFTRVVSYTSPTDTVKLYATPEFHRSFLFPASSQFYDACASQTIYD